MTTRYDAVVIGAGIHGAGCAQALSAAGHTVLVLEKGGVACATSCRSSKLIHGGLRYLETGQYSLVRESLREREILLRIAPGLVRRVPFYIPVYQHTTRNRLTLRAGLSLYALLDNLRPRSWYSAVPRRDWGSLDGLETRGLRAVFRYYDAQTDDAKLTHAVLRSAQSLGASVQCPAEFLGASRSAEGYRLRYRGQSGEQECEARAVVNAAGPWVNEVLARFTPIAPQADIDLVQGAHVVVDGGLNHGVYYLEAEDRRAVFVMPWRAGLSLIGTTETHFHGDPAQVAPRHEEIDYLLRTYHRYFPNREGDVRDQFAGLRVLPRANDAAFGRSRETLYMTDSDTTPRLVSVVGGKLTGYRAAAEKVATLLAAALPAREPRASTRTLALE